MFTQTCPLDFAAAIWESVAVPPVAAALLVDLVVDAEAPFDGALALVDDIGDALLLLTTAGEELALLAGAADVLALLAGALEEAGSDVSADLALLLCDLPLEDFPLAAGADDDDAAVDPSALSLAADFLLDFDFLLELVDASAGAACSEPPALAEVSLFFDFFDE